MGRSLSSVQACLLVPRKGCWWRAEGRNMKVLVVVDAGVEVEQSRLLLQHTRIRSQSTHAQSIAQHFSQMASTVNWLPRHSRTA